MRPQADKCNEFGGGSGDGGGESQPRAPGSKLKYSVVDMYSQNC